MQLTIDTKATIDCRHKKQNVYDKNGNLKNTLRKEVVSSKLLQECLVLRFQVPSQKSQ